MFTSKAIFMSSLAFKLFMRLVLFSLISPIQLSMKISFFRFDYEDFDVLFPFLCSVLLVSDVDVHFIPSAFIKIA